MDNRSDRSEREEQLYIRRRPCWEVWDEATRSQALAFAEGYKAILSRGKTERLMVREVEALIRERGFVTMEEAQAQGGNTAGLKVYETNRERAMVLATLGRRPMREGARFILAHIDSPRLDLKMQPLYEDESLALLKTHYYGGIKKYQWPAVPLALHGVVINGQGQRIEVSIGEDPADPVFMITDLLPHLSQKQMEKKLSEAIEAEELNVLVGSLPAADDRAKTKVKLNILAALNERYGIAEEDLVSADLEVVPAGAARDMGLDRSFISGYGHDDRSSAYAAVRALLDQEKPEHACICVLADKEETGSQSNTGVTSLFLYDFVGRLIALEAKDEDVKWGDAELRRALAHSQAISADVASALDPDYKGAFDERNTARIGHGVVLEKYTGARGKYGTSEASAEYMGHIRRIFNQAGVVWQPGTLGRVDLGGGGTVAMFLAEYNMDIVDCGPALLNMHAPYEILSKADLYSTFQAYSAFYAHT